MAKMYSSRCHAWDPYAVWQILLHRHPVRVEDPSGSCGHIERERLAEFCDAISEYPDFLQDTLLVIAHADGLEVAVDALDAAVREHLEARPLATRFSGAAGKPSG